MTMETETLCRTCCGDREVLCVGILSPGECDQCHLVWPAYKLRRVWKRKMTTKTKNWIPCSSVLPPVGLVVMTKIDDTKGPRNEQTLKRMKTGPNARSLWFVPDGSMYVYYEPTHWKTV